jgi:secreted Zn-dependent insulinase-like peptidase
LDRFAQFFISPTFNQSSVLRELKAVDSEHRKNLQSEHWRMFQLLKHVSSPETPFHGFATGNLESLNKQGVRAAMLAYHAAHYHAARMRLMVVSDHPLERMQSWVARQFVSVPRAAMPILGNPHLPLVYTTESIEILAEAAHQVEASARIAADPGRVNPFAVFPNASRATRIYSEPVTELHNLKLAFPVAPRLSVAHQRSGVYSFLTSLFGDEGKGSLLSYLKSSHLVETASASMEADTSGFSILSVEFTLSPSAINNATAATSDSAVLESINHSCDAISAAFFVYVRKIRARLEEAVHVGRVQLLATGNTLLAAGGADPLDGFVRTPMGDLMSWPGNSSAIAWRFWHDQLTMSEVAFQFPDKGEADDLASRLARLLHESDAADILAPPSRAVWQPGAILAALDQLRPVNILMFIESKAVPRGALTLAEPVYGTLYVSSKIEHSTLTFLDVSPESWVPASPLTLDVPPANNFIPRDFHLVRHAGYAEALGLVDIERLSEKQDEALAKAAGSSQRSSWLTSLLGGGPSHVDAAILQDQADEARAHALQAMLVPIHDLLAPLGFSHDQGSLQASNRSSAVSAWWLPDAYFGRPRSYLQLAIVTAAATSDSISSVLTSLYLSSVREALREASYTAARAGISASISSLAFSSGLTVSIECYSESLPLAAEVFSNALNFTSFDAVTVKNDLVLAFQSLRNAFKEQPYKRAMYYHDLYTGDRRYSTDALLRGAFELAGLPVPGDRALLRTSAVSQIDIALVLERLQRHRHALLSGVESVSIFVYGNENITSARRVISSVLNVLSDDGYLETLRSNKQLDAINSTAYMQGKTLPVGRTLAQLPPDNADDENSATVTVFQAGLRDSCHSELPPVSNAQESTAQATTPSFAAREPRALKKYAFQQLALEPSDGGVAPFLQDDTMQYRQGERAAVQAAAESPDLRGELSQSRRSTSPFARRRRARARFFDQLSGTTSLLASVATHNTASSSVRPSQGRDLYLVNESAIESAKIDILSNCDLRDAALDMIAILMRDPAFDELRTKQQLGYIVFAMNHEANTVVQGSKRANVSSISFETDSMSGKLIEQNLTVGTVDRPVYGDVVQSLVVLVQGSSTPANQLDERIAQFVMTFEKFLLDLDADTWVSAVRGVRGVSRRVPSSMAEAFSWEWEEINRRSFRNSRRVDEAVALRYVRLEHVIAMYRQIIGSRMSARILSIEMFGKNHSKVPPGDAAKADSVIDLVASV